MNALKTIMILCLSGMLLITLPQGLWAQADSDEVYEEAEENVDDIRGENRDTFGDSDSEEPKKEEAGKLVAPEDFQYGEEGGEGGSSSDLYGTYVAFDVDANTKDLFLGLSAGLSLSNHFFICLYSSVRPFKRTFFANEPSVGLVQYKEYRLNFGAGIEKIFFVSDIFGFYLFLGGGYSVGIYSGASSDAGDTFYPAGRAGFFLGLGGFSVKVGWEYMRLPQVPNNRGILSIAVHF
ncbi:MAG: hypothetical protein GY754_28240 [bacterium]|nr:hypothetical protein [bacterium]